MKIYPGQVLEYYGSEVFFSTCSVSRPVHVSALRFIDFKSNDKNCRNCGAPPIPFKHSCLYCGTAQ